MSKKLKLKNMTVREVCAELDACETFEKIPNCVLDSKDWKLLWKALPKKLLAEFAEDGDYNIWNLDIGLIDEFLNEATYRGSRNNKYWKKNSYKVFKKIVEDMLNN